MPKKSDFFWLSWHFEIIKISLCEGHHIWESVNSNQGWTRQNNFHDHFIMISSLLHDISFHHFYRILIINPIIWKKSIAFFKGFMESMGTVLYAILLQSIIVVAVMMITQSAIQIFAGVDIPIPALISKSLIFVVLGVVALSLKRRVYSI